MVSGPGEWLLRYWMKAENFSANCPNGSSGGMQRVRWMLDGGIFHGGREGVVPSNGDGKDFLCTSPGGSYDWTEFRSDKDRNGNLLPQEMRLVIQDNISHEINLLIENTNGTSGTAWIDRVELFNPKGEKVQIIGQFIPTRMDEDTAFFNRAYGVLLGGNSPVGVRMPLVRGETGIDTPGNQDWNRDLLLDTKGIWLHNIIWGQTNSGGMYDLFWWATETIPPSIYSNFLSYRNFMDEIPLNNGNYTDLKAKTTHPELRAWGQRDDLSGWYHLWIQNTNHTWSRIVHGPEISPIHGNVIIDNVQPGTYTLEWWDPYVLDDPIFKTEIVSSTGSLTLQLPKPLVSDLGIKIRSTK